MLKLIRLISVVMLLAGGAFAQTTTIMTGTVRDLSGAVVTSGQVTFTLQPGIDTVISGTGRFVTSVVTCSITGAGAVKALDGVSNCTLTNNMALVPTGTSYTACIQPGFVTPGSCFNMYALGGTLDITTVVPTPTTSPAYNFVDLFSAQTISGTKTFTGPVSFGNLGASTFNGNLTIAQPTLATAGANQSSFNMVTQASYWNGAASATDAWTLQDILGTGTNPTSTLTLTHSGSSGASTVSIPGAVTVGGTLGVTGAFLPCIDDGMYVAGSSCYATIAAARTAAGSNTVLIPSSYAGADSVADGNNPVVDLRNNVLKASHFFGCAYPMTNAPGGLDCSFEANGAGDLYIAHNTHVNPATTTAVTLNIGANTNFLVGSTTLFGTGGTAPLIIGRDTANEEIVASGSWSIIDGNHLTVTCAKTHSGTTDIEQLGVTQFDPGIAIKLDAHKPSQFSATTFPPSRWLDSNGSPFLITPGVGGATFPYGAVLFSSGTPLSCFTSGAGTAYLNGGNCIWRNYGSSNSFRIQDSTGILLAFFQDVSAGPNEFANDLSPTTAGGKNLGTSALPWGAVRFGTSGTGLINLINGDATATRNVTFPNAAGTIALLGLAQSWTATQTFNNGLVAAGSAAGLTGTGACATITTQHGGSWAGDAKCTGTTGASTLTITPGTTAPNGWICNVQDETTRANVFQQTSHTQTTCVLTVTSVTQNDVFVFSAIAY